MFVIILIVSVLVLYMLIRNNRAELYTTQTFKMALSWLIPIIGILGYTLAYSNLLNVGEEFNNIIIKISDVLVIGGFVGFLTNSSQFFGVYKSELEKIIFSTEYISTKNNVSELWRKISKIMYEEKFHNISEDLLNIIEQHYICKEEYSYYENYRIITDVKWADDNKEYINVIDNINFNLVTEKNGIIEIPFSTWMSEIEKLDDDPNYKCEFSCKINNENYEAKREIKQEENACLIIDTITLHNSKEKNIYDVSIKRERQYKFELDYDISFRCKFIIKDMAITLNLPNDMKASFICRGTPENFIKVKNTQTNKEYLYKGLILQRQGYIFALHKTNL